MTAPHRKLPEREDTCLPNPQRKSLPSTASAQHSALAAYCPSSSVSSSSPGRTRPPWSSRRSSRSTRSRRASSTPVSASSPRPGAAGRASATSLLGILFIIAGIVAFLNLGAATAWLAVFLGILVGILWIVEGIVALSTLGDAASKGWTVFFAIISIIAGIVLLFSPIWGAAVLWWLLGHLAHRPRHHPDRARVHVRQEGPVELDCTREAPRVDPGALLRGRRPRRVIRRAGAASTSRGRHRIARRGAAAGPSASARGSPRGRPAAPPPSPAA